MEKVVGSLVGVSYHTFDTIYNLIFTTERVIAFIIQNPSDIQLPSMFEQVFLGNMLSKRKERLNLAKATLELDSNLREKTIDDLLAMRELNFEIRYSAVTSVKITRGLFQSQLVFDTSSVRRTIRFNLSKKHIPDAQRLLELVLVSKIKEK